MKTTKRSITLAIATVGIFAASIARADFSVAYSCNNGAAVLDHEFVSLGMRGGDYHSYQFVIRDQGVINYLLQKGAVGFEDVHSDGHEIIIRFHTYPPYTFTNQGYLQHGPSRGENGYMLRIKGNGILFETTDAPYGAPANWFFEDCQQIVDESR